MIFSQPKASSWSTTSAHQSAACNETEEPPKTRRQVAADEANATVRAVSRERAAKGGTVVFRARKLGRWVAPLHPGCAGLALVVQSSISPVDRRPKLDFEKKHPARRTDRPKRRARPPAMAALPTFTLLIKKVYRYHKCLWESPEPSQQGLADPTTAARRSKRTVISYIFSS